MNYMILILTLTSLTMMKAKNPMKMCWKMTIFMSSSCLVLQMKFMMKFMLIIMSTMMIGGILILYMLLVSICFHNNSKKKMTWMKMVILFMLISMINNEYMEMSLKEMKTKNYEFTTVNLNSNYLIKMSIFLLMIYMLSNLNILEEQKLSMRSFS